MAQKGHKKGTDAFYPRNHFVPLDTTAGICQTDCMSSWTCLHPLPELPLYVAVGDQGLCRLAMGIGQQEFLAELSAASGENNWRRDERHPLIRETLRQLDDYFQGRLREFRLPLDLQGTRFQLRVWNALLRIPYGKTSSYSALARRIGSPKAARAVGSANGQNPIPIVVPCHRVVNADGGLGGYSCGLRYKKMLLDLEAEANPMSFLQP